MKILCAALISALLVGCSGSKQPSFLGQEAPYTRVTSLEGEYLPLQLGNKPTAVIFWASWCSRSRTEIQQLDELASKRRDIRFMAISVDKQEDREKMEEFIRAGRIDNLELFFSGNGPWDEAFVSFGLDEVPYLYLIDATGTVVAEGTEFEDLFSAR